MMFVGVAGFLGLVGVADAAATKVYVCHYTDSETNEVVLIEVSENAVPTLIDKGDILLPPDAVDCSGEIVIPPEAL